MKLTNFSSLNLSQWQLSMCEYYCENNMKRLKKMCYRLIKSKSTYGNKDYDDLIDEAMFTLIESVLSFDEKKNNNFKGYLYSNIQRCFYDWTRDQKREMRTNYLHGSDGKVKTDKDREPIVLESISLETPLREADGKERDMSEIISSGFDLEKFVCNKDCREYDTWHKEMKDFLYKLSPMQQKIAMLIAYRYDREEICDVLHISKSFYNESFKMICRDKNTKSIEKLATRKEPKPL